MLLTLGTFVVLFLALLGQGQLVVTALRRAGVATVVPRIWTTFWLGFASTLALATSASLFCRVSAVVTLALATIAVAGWLGGARLVAHRLRRVARHGRARLGLYAAAIAVVPLVAAYSAGREVRWFDTVTTHLGQVRWISDYGTVPGLANLRPTFGFDSAFDVFAALLNHGWWRDRVAHVVVAFVFAMTVLHWVAVVLFDRSLRTRLFCLLSLPFFVPRVWSTEMASVSCDLPMACMSLFVGLTLIELPDLERSPTQRRFALIVATTVAAAALAVKLSGLAVLATVAAIALAALPRERKRWRFILAASALPIVLVASVVARRIVLTGWPLYPIPVGRLPLGWSVPRSTAEGDARWIASWARIPNVAPAEVLDQGFLHWFVPWLRAFRGVVELYLFSLTLLAIAVHLLSPRLRRWTRWELATPMVALASLAYWFIGAPDPRFGAVYFWIAFASVVATILVHATVGRPAEWLRRLFAWAAAAAAMVTALFIATIAVAIHRGVFKPMALYAPEWLRVAADPEQPTRPRRYGDAEHPLIINVAGANGCGNAPLPCTHVDGPVRLRVPGRLASGFLPREEETPP